MFYLMLAILSSALISILMRLSKEHVHNDMFMFMANYCACAVLSAGFGIGQSFRLPEGAPAVWLGIVSGVMYLASFMLLQTNIRQNGVVLSATFMKLGVLVPTLMALLVYHEQPSPLSVIGFLIALAAIIIINGRPSEKPETPHTPNGLLLMILLLSGGFTDSLANIYDKSGPAAMKDFYLLITFVVAALFSLGLAVKKRQHPTLTDIGWGLLIGIPNYFSSRFILLALAQLPAMVVFPVFNIAVILIVSLAGILFFRESMGKQQKIGLGLILIALVLLNL